MTTKDTSITIRFEVEVDGMRYGSCVRVARVAILDAVVGQREALVAEAKRCVADVLSDVPELT